MPGSDQDEIHTEPNPLRRLWLPLSRSKMSNHDPIVITLPGGRRVDAQVGTHTIHTDQPRDNGGEDLAPAPYDVFLASIGACAGIFVQGFCAKRDIPTGGIRIVERPSFGADGELTEVDLELQLPPSFPEKYRDAVVKVAAQCSVKRAIAAQPKFIVRATTGT